MIYLKMHGCTVGKGLRCHTFPRFRITPKKNLSIGNKVTIGYDITFEIVENGILIIGDYVKLTQDVLISSGLSIKIGSNTLVGERVSIRDGSHSFKTNENIINQPSKYTQIKIGKDVWIGAGSFVLEGSDIPDGVVIGANSVVTSSSVLNPYFIYAGVPVHMIKPR